MIHSAQPTSNGSWADGPLLAFDLETTGTDTATDRVVTATVITIIPGQQPVERTWLADPGMEIPAEASEVHGISTDYARVNGRDAATVIAEVAETLSAAWDPATPLCAFNACFDLSLLHAELRRHHRRDLVVGGPVVDPLCIDRELDRFRKGSRNLGAMCAHHRVRLDGAHTSAGDALAAARLAWRLARTYPDQVGQVPLASLHRSQVGWYHKQSHRFADYLEQLARRAADPAEASQLWQRATTTRSTAADWPYRKNPQITPLGV